MLFSLRYLSALYDIAPFDASNNTLHLTSSTFSKVIVPDGEATTKKSHSLLYTSSSSI